MRWEAVVSSSTLNVRPSGPFEKWGTKLRLGETLFEVTPRVMLNIILLGDIC